MSDDEAWQRIDAEILEVSATDPQSIEILLAIAREYPENRFAAIEKIGDILFPQDHLPEQVIEALMAFMQAPDNADDGLTRCNVLEILEDHPHQTRFEIIRPYLDDAEAIVQKQAAATLAAIGDKRAVRLIERKIEVCDESTLPAMYNALYHLGKTDYFTHLLACIHSKNARTRVLAINTLVSSSYSRYRQTIIAHFRHALTTETNRPAREAIDEALAEMMS